MRKSIVRQQYFVCDILCVGMQMCSCIRAPSSAALSADSSGCNCLQSKRIGSEDSHSKDSVISFVVPSVYSPIALNFRK